MIATNRFLLLLIATLLMATTINGSAIVRGQHRALGVNNNDPSESSEGSDESGSSNASSKGMESDDDDDSASSKSGSMESDDDDSSDEHPMSAKGSSGKGKGGSMESSSSKGASMESDDDEHPMSAKGSESSSSKGASMESSDDDSSDEHPMSSKGASMESDDDEHPMSAKGSSGKGKGGSMDDDEHSMSAKGSSGKGKGGSMESDDDEHPMSAKGSSGKGKGKGKGGSSTDLSSKNSKKMGSSTKNPKKSSKKGSKKNPEGPGTMTPEPVTAVPTSEDSFAVRPPPFALFYSFEDDSVADPSIDEFAQLAEVTRLFLEKYMEDKYAQTSIIILDDFLTFLTRSDSVSRPAMGVFRSVSRFNPRSIFYPPRSEIEDQIEIAFTDPASQMMYLQRLKEDLPADNVFTTVTAISYGEPTDSMASGRSASGFATAGIAAAAAGIVVLAVGVVLLGRQRHEDDANSVDKLNAGKLKENATVTSETTASTTWRPSAADLNVDELQDEPLDDYHQQRHYISKLDTAY